jgi:hypothetical protein
MSNISRWIGAAAVAAGLLGASAAAAADAPAAPQTPCFFVNQWQGWKAPSPDVIYLRVNLHDIYKVELSAGSDQLMWPDTHLVSIVRGSDSICSAIDLDLKVAGPGGFKEGLIAKSLTKLTPDEVAAIPKKYLP